MALRYPWLEQLIEAELEEVVGWKSKIKHEPGTPRIAATGRLSDDGSNFRSLVDRSDLESQSELQIVKAYISKVAQCLVSDGEVHVRATLTSEAWAAYEAGLEAGQEPSQGDLICCKQFSVISTPFGPSDERIQLRIEELEYVGKYRKTLGDPKPVNQRAKVQQLLEEVTRIRAEQDDDHVVQPSAARNRVPATSDHSASPGAEIDGQAVGSGVGRTGVGESIEPTAAVQTGTTAPQRHSPIASQGSVGRASTASKRSGTKALGSSPRVDITDQLTGQSAHEEGTNSVGPEQALGGGKLLGLLNKKATKRPTEPAQLSAPVGSAPSSSVTKRRKLAHDVEASPATQHAFSTQAVQPRRRKRASLVGDGVGMAKGVNNAGPVPPSSRRADARSMEEQQPALSTNSSPSPMPAPAHREIEAHVNDAPTSAQPDTPAIEERVRSQDPTEDRQHRNATSAGGPMVITRPSAKPNSTSLRPQRTKPKRHKIAADQMALLEAKSCHVPPMPGRQLPHPNVPIAVLQAWNSRHASTDDVASTARQEAANGFKIASPQSTASLPAASAAESEEHLPSASESDVSEDIPWSQSPTQRALPLDSSAGEPKQRSPGTPSRLKLSLGTAAKGGSQSSVTMRNGMFGVSGLQPTDRPPHRSGDNTVASSPIADLHHSVSQIALRPSPDRRPLTQAGSASASNNPIDPRLKHRPGSRGSSGLSQASASSASGSLRGYGSPRARGGLSSQSAAGRPPGSAAPVNAPTGPRLSRGLPPPVHGQTNGTAASSGSQPLETQRGPATAASRPASQHTNSEASQIVPSTNYESFIRAPEAQASASSVIVPGRHSGFELGMAPRGPRGSIISTSQASHRGFDHSAQRPTSVGSMQSQVENIPLIHSTPKGPSLSERDSPHQYYNNQSPPTDRRALRLLDKPTRLQQRDTDEHVAARELDQVHPSRLTLVEQSPAKATARTPTGPRNPDQPELKAFASQTGSPGHSSRPGTSSSGSQVGARKKPTWHRITQSLYPALDTGVPDATSSQVSRAGQMQDVDMDQGGSSQRNSEGQNDLQRDSNAVDHRYPDAHSSIGSRRGGDTYRPNYDAPRQPPESRRLEHPLPTKPATQTPASSNDLPMEIPKPLDYREGYQQQRREFFRTEQRKKWLSIHLTDDIAIVRLPAWLAEYRKSFPKDPATEEQFAAVLSRLRPDIEVTGRAPAPSLTDDDAKPQKPLPSVVASTGPSEQRDSPYDSPPRANPTQPSTVSNDEARSTISSTKANSLTSSSRRSSRRSLPWATQPEKPAITTPQQSLAMQSAESVVVSPVQQTSQAPPSTVTLAAPQQTTKGAAAPGMTVFTEFARSWHAIRPGGAFARPIKTASRSRAAAAKLDVLSWGFRQ